jgi:hypothetical protein
MIGISRTGRLLIAAAWLLVGALALGQWLAYQPTIQIDWQTETEFDSAGFNLLRARAESGPYVRINERLIPASTDAAAGAHYTFLDTEVSKGQQYYYQLEDVDLSGGSSQHAPITFVAPDQPIWLLLAGVASLVVGIALGVSLRTKS